MNTGTARALAAAVIISSASSAMAIDWVSTPDVGSFAPDADWGAFWYRATLQPPANSAAVADYTVNLQTLGSQNILCHHYARKSAFGALHHIFVPRWAAEPERHSAVDPTGTLGDAASGPTAVRSLHCLWMAASPPSTLLIEYRREFARDNNAGSL